MEAETISMPDTEEKKVLNERKETYLVYTLTLLRVLLEVVPSSLGLTLFKYVLHAHTADIPNL